MAAKDREIAELKALMRKFLDKTADPPTPEAPSTQVSTAKASGGNEEELQEEEKQGDRPTKDEQDGPKPKNRRLEKQDK